MVDGITAGAVGRNVAARTFPVRAVSLRYDRAACQRFRVAHVHRLRTRRPGGHRIDPHRELQRGERRSEQFDDRARRPHGAGAVSPDAVPRGPRNADDFDGRAGDISHREVRSARRPAERWLRRRRVDDDPGAVFTDVLLVADRPHPADAPQPVTVFFQHRKRAGCQRVRHRNRISRAGFPGLLLFPRRGRGIQRDPELAWDSRRLARPPGT